VSEVAWIGSIAAVAIYLLAGSGSARDFATVYVIERSLSLDNLFLFLLILAYFQVPDVASVNL
jgi:tellurite resistance protein TerC